MTDNYTHFMRFLFACDKQPIYVSRDLDCTGGGSIPRALLPIFFGFLCLVSVSCGGGTSSSGGSTITTPAVPQITAISATPTSTTAKISWTTDQSSSSTVNYGPTTAYGKTSSSTALVTAHSASLASLACGTTYHYQVVSANSTGQTATSSDQTFGTTSSGDPNINCAPVSDNFDSATLNTALWSVVDPIGDGVVSMTGTGATINLPQGSVHDTLTPGSAPVELLETITDTDFKVLVRFQSSVQLGLQQEGIIARQDAKNYVAFKVYNDGTNVHIYSGQTSNGTDTTVNDTVVSLIQAPIWLQLQRSGNTWTGQWSLDGTNYTAAAAFSFPLTISTVGPFAGNYNVTSSDAPAFSAIVDYFFNVASEASNQDGPAPYTAITVDANPATPLLERVLVDVQGTGKLNPVIGYGDPSDGIYWYGYPASGRLTDPWPKYTIISNGSAYGDMVALDVNGDGAVDIIASYTPPGGISSIVWFQNPRGQGGDPTTAAWTMHTIGAGIPASENNLVIADFDGDGKMDVATPSYIYFQNGPDSWTQVQYNNATRAVALLDIGSGNGSTNLVGTAANATATYTAVWFENPRETGGNARTSSWIMHNIGATYPCTASTCQNGDVYVPAYASGDFDGDGRMDVVMGQSEGPNGSAPPPGGLTWFEAPADRRNGTWTQHTIDATYIDTQTIRVVDIDQNGTLDLVTAEQDQSLLRRVSVFHNNGQGTFTPEILSNVGGYDLAIGNVRGTGAIDILNSAHGVFGAVHPVMLFLNPLSALGENAVTSTKRPRTVVNEPQRESTRERNGPKSPVIRE